MTSSVDDDEEFKVTLPDPIYPRKRYPYIDKELTVEGCFRLMRWSDVGIWTTGTVGSWLFGFLKGYPVRFATAGLMGTVGFTFGSFVVIQNVRARVMGYSENAREVEWYKKRKAARNAAMEKKA